MSEQKEFLEDAEEKPKTKEERLSDFIKAYKIAKAEMQVYKDHISDMKESYVKNNWLSKDEIKLALKAWRMVEDGTDLKALEHFYETVK